MSRLALSLSTLALAAALALAPPAAGQGCVPFQGIDHCPAGAATLSTTPDGDALIVAGTGSADDGVASIFPPTVHWAAQMAFPPGGSSGQELSFASISGGEATSHMTLEPVDGGYALSASFTGHATASTYSALVYRNGVLQGSLGGIDSNLAATGGPVMAASREERPHRRPVIIIIIIIVDRPRPTFSIAPSGGCNWGLSFGQNATFQLPDGSELVGDEIRLMEEVSGPGHYPYLGFESIETRSTAPQFSITGELTAGTE